MNCKIIKQYSVGFVFQLFCLVSFAQSASEIQLVTSSCDWKPPSEKAILEINKPLLTYKEIKENIDDPVSYDKAIISKKGRKYFYSLPNKNCKSDLFIVRTDTVIVINSYREGSDIYYKIAYDSVLLKKIIIGWVLSDGVCPYEPVQNIKVRCGI